MAFNSSLSSFQLKKADKRSNNNFSNIFNVKIERRKDTQLFDNKAVFNKHQLMKNSSLECIFIIHLIDTHFNNN